MSKTRRPAFILAVVLAGVLCHAPGAIAAEAQKAIYYYTGCANPEVYSDIRHSASGIQDFASKNNVRLIEVTKPHRCGYLLVLGERRKYIKSALTDVDLETAARQFFALPTPAPNPPRR